MAVMYPAILDTELSKEEFKVDLTFIHEVVNEMFKSLPKPYKILHKICES